MNVADFTSEHARWQAVESRDARADNAFVFAVVTTGIFCRPSCRARRPLRETYVFIRMPAPPARQVFAPANAASRQGSRLRRKKRSVSRRPVG